MANKLLYAFIFICLLVISLIRPLNYDEAYYLVSSSLLKSGNLPYTDFIFHQPPLILVPYILVSGSGFLMLMTGRVLSIIMLMLAFFIFRKILVKFLIEDNKSGLLIFTISFFLNSFLIDWTVIVKSYSLSILILSLCLFYFQEIIEKANKRNVIFCSLFFALLLLIKISFVLVCMTYISFLLYRVIRKNIPFKVLIIGIITFLIPFFLFIIIYYNNLDLVKINLFDINFAMSEGYSTSSNLLKPVLFFLLPQNLILLIIILFSGFKYILFEKFIILATVSFLIVHLFTQMLPEYFVPVIPLMALLAAMRFELFNKNFNSFFKRNLNLKKWIIAITSDPS